MHEAVTKIVRVSAVCSVMLVFLFSGCAVGTASDSTLSTVSATPLSLSITSPSSNVELFTNLANVLGTVSTPDAAVKVQGHAAYVDAQGNFTGYALLSEGANTIDVEASANGQTHSQVIILDFTPPLAIFLNEPKYGVDYTQNPLIATGCVSDPGAAVTVNGIMATVSADGSFSVPIRVSYGDTLTAIATLGDKTDSMSFRILLYPPTGPIPIVRQDFNHLIYIEAGETFTQQMTIDMAKLIDEPSTLSYQLMPVAFVNDRQQKISWPTGLEISIQPSSFIAYPDATYSSLMVFKAASDMPSGEYNFEVDTTIDDGPFIGAWIKVVVVPKGGSIGKTIEVNQSQTVDGITFTLQKVELSAKGMIVTAFNTPPGYSLPQGPNLAPPQFMVHATGSYSIDTGIPVSAGYSGIRFLDSGVLHTWVVNMPVPKDARTLIFTITSLGDWQGQWSFKVPLG